MHVAKDDTVIVLSGKYRGKMGRVLRVYPDEDKLIVEHVNVIKRHTRPNPQRSIKGGILDREAPIALANVAVVCRECGRPTRIGRRHTEGGKSGVRYCVRCKAAIDK